LKLLEPTCSFNFPASHARRSRRAHGPGRPRCSATRARYRLSVVVMLECPSRSCTRFAFAPAAISSARVPQVVEPQPFASQPAAPPRPDRTRLA
jgi:hypothetical protein